MKAGILFALVLITITGTHIVLPTIGPISPLRTITPINTVIGPITPISPITL